MTLLSIHFIASHVALLVERWMSSAAELNMTLSRRDGGSAMFHESGVHTLETSGSFQLGSSDVT